MGLRHEVLTLGDHSFFRHSGPDSLLLDEPGNDVSDLIERLRGTSMIYADSGNDAYVAHITKEAADAIEQKDKRIAELEGALGEAMDTVEIFHGPTAWDIYRDKSPEMIRWRELLPVRDTTP